MTSAETDRASGPDFVAFQIREPDGSRRFYADRLYAELEQAGVRVIQPPQDSPFGRYVVTADSDGYAVALHASEDDE